jgi:hypothetical protein
LAELGTAAGGADGPRRVGIPYFWCSGGSRSLHEAGLTHWWNGLGVGLSPMYTVQFLPLSLREPPPHGKERGTPLVGLSPHSTSWSVTPAKWQSVHIPKGK